MRKFKQNIIKNLLRIWCFNSLFFRYPFSLDIHVCEHCNLSCKGCNHYSPLADPSFCDIDSLKKNLNALKNRGLNKIIKSLYLVGGEPLLNPEITEIFRITRENFPKSIIKVVTNGICLSRNIKPLPDLFWESCRKYSISFDVSKYPINIDYNYIKEVFQTNKVKFNFFIERGGRNNFKSFLLNPGRENNKKFNYYNCVLCRCLQLIGDRIYPCPISGYVRHLNKAYNMDFKHTVGDYIEVKNISKWKLRLFRLKAKPFCKYCVFPRPNVDWEPSTHGINEWVTT